MYLFDFAVLKGCDEGVTGVFSRGPGSDETDRTGSVGAAFLYGKEKIRA